MRLEINIKRLNQKEFTIGPGLERKPVVSNGCVTGNSGRIDFRAFWASVIKILNSAALSTGLRLKICKENKHSHHTTEKFKWKGEKEEDRDEGKLSGFLVRVPPSSHWEATPTPCAWRSTPPACLTPVSPVQALVKSCTRALPDAIKIVQSRSQARSPGSPFSSSRLPSLHSVRGARQVPAKRGWMCAPNEISKHAKLPVFASLVLHAPFIRPCHSSCATPMFLAGSALIRGGWQRRFASV